MSCHLYAGLSRAYGHCLLCPLSDAAERKSHVPHDMKKKFSIIEILNLNADIS